MSTFSPVCSLSSNCLMCVVGGGGGGGRNELKVCTMVSFSHIISVYSVLCQCIRTNTRILKPFEDREPTGLKVDIG